MQQDIKIAQAFLTNISAPDENDLTKLQQIICYLSGTPHLPLTLETNNIGFIVNWWVDVAIIMHHDIFW